MAGSDSNKWQYTNALTVVPEEIVLRKKGHGKTGWFTINNNMSSSIIYKIKSTNSNAFKIEPSKGIVKGHHSVNTKVTLISGSKCSDNETFLLMAAITDRDEMSRKDIHEALKTTDLLQYYFNCIVLSDTENSPHEAGDSYAAMENVDNQLKKYLALNFLTLIVVMVLMFFAIFNKEECSGPFWS